LEKNRFPVPVSVLNIQKLLSFNTARRLFSLSRLIRKSGIDIVHIFFNDASTVAPPFAKLGGAKVVVSRRDMGFWYNSKNLPILKGMTLFVDRLVANSRAVKENAKKREGFSEKKSVVIYNGYDEIRFNAPPSQDFRKCHEIGPHDPIIGIVANLYPMKRHSDLVRAFKILHEKFENAHLVLAGEGAEETSLKELVRTLYLEKHVHFLGSVTGVIPIIKHFTLGVLCSESEGLSNAILEYMGCGKPTICTNVGGNPELIRDGYNGFLVGVGDVKNMAEKMMSILSDSSLTEKMGANARETVIREFPMEKMVSSYAKLYEELTEKGSS
ncbi:MAG TPA: glycosyltransferase, partial [Nitrospiria bacterium]|nr:glycosyltransferase [Nitrospiria bacterium]